MTRTLFAVALAALALTACGGKDDKADPIKQMQDEVAALPTCADAWQAGKTLPKDYSGCRDGETLVTAVWAGPCQMVGYDDRFWAIPGDVIHEGGSDDPAYTKAFSEC